MNDVAEILKGICQKDPCAIGRAISIVEDGDQRAEAILQGIDSESIKSTTIIGITGTTGVGKSTLVEQLIVHYRRLGYRVGIIAIDPSSSISGGAILGDRIRMMKHVMDQDVVIRSMATRGRSGGLCAAAGAAARIMAFSGCNPIIIETAGVGQSEIDVISFADNTILVLAPGLGDDIQAIKAGLVEIADILVVNKADCPEANTLMIELELAVRDKNCMICKTIATKNVGIEELATVIKNVDLRKRQNGLFKQKRQIMEEKEVLDWVIEIMREKFKNYLMTHTIPIKVDPRKVARELVDKFYKL